MYDTNPASLVMHPSGNFMLSASTGASAIRYFSLRQIPHVEYASPKSVSVGASTVISLRGYRMGGSSADLVSITYGLRGNEQTCSTKLWVSAVEVRCTIAPTAATHSNKRIYFLITSKAGMSSQHYNASVIAWSQPQVQLAQPSQTWGNVDLTITLSGLYFAAEASELIAVTSTATPITAGPATLTQPCTEVKWISSTSLTCLLGAHVPANYRVQFIVQRTTVTSALSAYLFTTIAPPASIKVNSLCPSSAPAFSFPLILLTGVGFGTSVLDIDKIIIAPVNSANPSGTCANVVWLSSTQLTCNFPSSMAPPTNPGPFRFIVVSHGREATPSPNWSFGTGTTPVLTGVSQSAIDRATLPARVTFTGINFGCGESTARAHIARTCQALGRGRELNFAMRLLICTHTPSALFYCVHLALL
jgi:hypothetical protein